MVVDDDPASQFLLRMVLENLKLASTIVPLSNGLEALDYVQQHCMNQNSALEKCPDWILLDLNMPGMGGLEFLGRLKTLEQSNLIHATVTIVTSSNHKQDREEAARYGVKEYLIKPVTEEMMQEYINATGKAK